MKQVLIAIDQLVNAIFGGWADESISAHAWRQRHKQPFKTLQPVIDRLFFSPTHCMDAYFSELKRSQLPPEYRQ